MNPYKSNQQILFVHVPKTGGNTMVDFLLDNNLPYFDPCKFDKHFNKHSKLQEYLEFGIENVYKMSIVRNPFDRIISFYNFFGVKQFSKLSFEEYIDKIEGFHIWLQPAYDFFVYNGNYNMDFIAKLENIEQDILILCEMFGLEKQKVQVKNPNHTTEQFTYTPKQKQKIYDVFYNDFKFFNYS